MTQFFQRSALMLLATGALCAGPVEARARHHHHHAAKPVGANGKVVGVAGDRGAYVVRKGDTLEKIADKLDTTVDDLKALNGLKSAVIQPGDVLHGPRTAKKAYAVVHGDTLFSIAKRFHVSIDDLRAANGLSAKTALRTGQKLHIPGADGAPPAVEKLDGVVPAKGARGRHATAPGPDDGADLPATGGHSVTGRLVNIEGRGAPYRVRKGDTLEKIARKLDTDIDSLKGDNHLKSSALRPGQVLRGPGISAKGYVAGAGDTLALVGQRFGVSVERLRSENGLSRRTLLKPGQKLRLPSGYRDHGPLRASEPSEVVERPTRSYPRPAEPSRDEAITTQRGSELPSHPQPYQPSGSPQRIYVPPAVVPGTTPAPSDAQVSQLGKGRFNWPIRGELISEFGPKDGGQRNDGINIRADSGASVRSAADGDVVYAGDQVPGFGNLVLIKHADGWVTAYGHLNHVDVKMQQKVMQGQQIGQAGVSGGVSEPQLHFEVRYAPNPLERARPVDPKLVLPR